MNQIKEFVMDYFKANNAKVLKSKNQITIQVPKRLSEKLKCEQILNITFDKKIAEKNPDIDFIAIGSALLNRILKNCEKRGLTVIKQYKGKPKFEGLEFNFKISFESIDKKEKLIDYLISLKDKKFNNKLLKKSKNKNFNEGKEISLNSEVIEECYSLCLNQLKKEIKPELNEINKKLKIALDKEKRIIEKFYDGIIADLRKRQEGKINIWKEKKQKAHTSQYVELREKYRKEITKYEEKIMEVQEKNFEELNNYFQIKQKRLKELENQYMLKTKILLCSTALVIIR